MIPKAYEPAEVETKWYRFWLDHDYFHADELAPKAPFSIVLPPPNVTGSLHLGHALMCTLQDILIRWRRMQAFNALWLPSTDHAGIATQLMVEREIKRTENKTRHDLGREEFLKRAWQWKEKYGNRILDQMKALGCSLDWDRERFTMDEGLSEAVRECFVRLYEEGLIYRARRLINWCTRCQTALSDLEVEKEEEAGSIWHIKYPVDGGTLTVATTRPETLLGDTAVAVHPDDDRYKHLIGKKVALPLCDREIPIIGDGVLVSMEFGTGAVKVTPGHDESDFETGLRHNLEQLSIVDLDGKLIAPAPEKYVGMTVAEARQAVLSDLDAAGFLEKQENHTVPMSRCGRCDTAIEPILSLQWFVKIKPLAEPAIAAVSQGKTKFVPESWTKTYMHWMHNIKDWCISRQLWWGHRIPAWICQACNEVTVERGTPSACSKCDSEDLVQDDDVLDTWFSSALLPFSALGWPEMTRSLRNFYPSSVMETGHDIIFFWVARMMMMGLHFMGKVPFRTVFLHSMVVDDQGKKMSKTRGNVIDPLDVVGGATVEELLAKTDGSKKETGNIQRNFPRGIPAMGADALRFTLALQAAQGRSIRFSVDRVEASRHFANKIWNASRFVLMNIEGFDADRFADNLFDGPESMRLSLADQWILSRVQTVANDVDASLNAYRIQEAAQLLYRFLWHDLCDWYIELCKPALYDDAAKGDDPHAVERRRLAQGTLVHTLEIALRLLHPFMPYLSEEIWQRLPKPAGIPASIMITLYPTDDPRFSNRELEKDMELLMEVAVAIRNIRAEYSIAPSRELDVVLVTLSGKKQALLSAERAIIEIAAKAKVTVADEAPTGGATAKAVVGADVVVSIALEGVVDKKAELLRLGKEKSKVEKDIALFEKKLNNPKFVDRAPPEVVEKDKSKLADFRERFSRIENAIAKLD